MQEIKKILFLAEGQMGDSIVLTPALKAVKQKYPYAKTTILLFHRRKYLKSSQETHPYIERSAYEGTAEIFKDNPFADEVLELDRKAMRGLKGIKRLKAERACIKYLKAQKFDAVISTFPQNRFVLWSYFAGIRIRIGEKGQQFDWLLTDKPSVKRCDAGVLNYFCDLLKPLGIYAEDKAVYFYVTDNSKKEAEEILRNKGIKLNEKLLLIHPGASDKDRQWPPEKMAELMKRLSENKDLQILTAYSEYDEEYVQKLEVYSKKPLVKIKTEKISELAALLSFADAALVHNSGPRHLAAAVGTKTIGLLEKYDDIMWKIYEDDNFHKIIISGKACNYCSEGKCRGIIPNGAVYGASCMHDISIEEVFNTVKNTYRL